MMAHDKFGDIWFQQDSCPAHSDSLLLKSLNNTFSTTSFIDREEIMLWPPTVSLNIFIKIY